MMFLERSIFFLPVVEEGRELKVVEKNFYFTFVSGKKLKISWAGTSGYLPNLLH